MTREERIMAYADGELDAAGVRVFELEMQVDPTLAAQVAAHRAVRDRVARAYAGVLQESVPMRLSGLTSKAAARGATGALGRAHDLPVWAALAACLVLGVFAGQALPERGPLEARADGTLVARRGLAEALDAQLSGDAGAVKIGLTFRDRDGRLCRTFQSTKDGLAGVACREGGTWTTTAIVRHAQQASAAEYRMAGSAAPPAVLATVDQMIAGEALDRSAEAAARAKSWRP